MLGKLVVYSVLIVLISYEFNVYLNPREYTAVVETVNGKVQGIISESRGGRRFGEFYGIPFAQPPVGELRFAAPRPAENWTDIYIADLDGIECIHVEFILDLGVQGVEDCLTLNVFTPDPTIVERVVEKDSQEEKELLPVIVFIYGGGFMSGSSKKFKGAYFMDQDVILVTFNYRLGALGFLNTGNAVKGNMGLKDQVMALRWIQENIKKFGGDPNQVTILGESAGAVSVQMHILSPLSRGLFQKAISLSGHALVPWAVIQDPARQAQRLGEQLSCSTIMSSDFLKCLQKLDARDIVILHRSNRFSMVDPLEGYGPTIETILDDETFLSRTPEEIMRANDYVKVPWITGVNDGEGLLWVARVILDTEVAEKLKNIKNWYEGARRFLYFEDNHSQEEIKQITRFYFGFKKEEEPRDFDPLSKMENFSNLISDRIFQVKLQKIIEDHQNPEVNEKSSKSTSKTKTKEIIDQETDAPLYLYYYTYSGQFSMFKIATAVPNNRFLASQFYMAYSLLKDRILSIIYGDEINSKSACHADELPLLFNMGLGLNVGLGSKDYPVSAEFIKTISNFAKKGNSELTFHGKEWPAVQPGSKESANFMTIDIEEKSKLISSPFETRVKFWDTLNQETL